MQVLEIFHFIAFAVLFFPSEKKHENQDIYQVSMV